jgi:hypothetical protein
MSVIDVSTLEPVGEFGSKAWGEACAAAAIKILEAANLPDDIEWAFTEEYLHPPARLIEDGREQAGYFIMVRNGQVTAGDGIPQECLELPGFHVRAVWAVICNQSGAIYGPAGQAQRTVDQGVLMAAIEQYVGRPNPFDLALDADGNPSHLLKPAFWPDEVATALREGNDEGNGLHNIAATLQSPSPEFGGLPVTALRVPIFAEMTDQQQTDFVRLCGTEA